MYNTKDVIHYAFLLFQSCKAELSSAGSSQVAITTKFLDFARNDVTLSGVEVLSSLKFLCTNLNVSVQATSLNQHKSAM